MPDISLCSNVKCPLKYRCGRYLGVPSSNWQTYSGFQPIANKCDGFWDVQDYPYNLDTCKNADERNQKLEDDLKVDDGK